MKNRLSSLVAGAAAAAIALTGLVSIGGTAEAYSGTPPWAAGDTSAKGGLVFYDASGNIVTSGSDVNTLTEYIGSDTTVARTTAVKAALKIAFPDHANAIPSTWFNNELQGSTTFSPKPAGVPAGIPTDYPFVVTDFTSSPTLVEDTLSAGVQDSSSATYTNVFELRMQDSGPATPADGNKYWRADIEYNPSTALSAYDGLAPGAWRVIYPTPVAAVATTTTTPTASPVSPQVVGTSVTFSTTVAPASGTLTGGTVKFFDGVTQIGVTKSLVGSATSGSPVTVASDATTSLAVGTRSITAEYTAGSASFSGSTSSALSFVVTAAPTVGTTTTTPTASPTSPQVAGTSVTFSTTVAPVSGTLTGGSVKFFNGATQIGATKSLVGSATSGSPVLVSSDATTSLAVGTRSITAQYTPTDAAFSGSTSSALSFVVTAAPAANTATTITATSPNATATTSDAISVTAHVANSDVPATVPTGTVAIKADGTQVATGTVDGSGNAVGVIPASVLSVGTHALTAEYTPSGNFNASTTAGSTSYAITLALPVNALAPMAGTAKVGAVSTCNAGVWTYAGVYTYKWFLDASVTAFATGISTSALPAGYVGHKIRCEVTASNPGGSAIATSAQVVVAAGAASKNTVRPKIVGTPAVGKKLTANRGTWVPAPASYLYVWKIGSLIVSRATTYTPPAKYKGKSLVLSVYAVRTGYLTGVASSLAVKIK
jgi:hypothetical protein